MAASSPKTRHPSGKAEAMPGRWEVFVSKVLLVAEEAMARWTAGAVLEESVERRAGTPGRGAQVSKRACWALTLAVQSS